MTGFRHEALLYEGDSGFLDALLPPLREGLSRDAEMLVALPAPRLAMLRGALGADAERIDFADMFEVGRNPGRLIALWRAFVADRAGSGKPLYGVGEPVWPGRTPIEVVECQRHECLLNRAFEDDPDFWLGCPYDVAGLDEFAVAGAYHSHPVVSGEPSHDHRDELPGEDLAPPPADATRVEFTTDDLPGLRHVATSRAEEVGLAERRADLVLVVNELATNTIRHGGGRGEMRSWVEDGSIVFEVRDRGFVPDPLTGRRRPEIEQLGGRGLWIVNELSDLVQMRSSPDGTVVRVRMASAPATAAG